MSKQSQHNNYGVQMKKVRTIESFFVTSAYFKDILSVFVKDVFVLCVHLLLSSFFMTE